MSTPHKYHRSSIHFWILFPIAFAIIVSFLFGSCSPQKGCYGTRGMSGYSYIKNLETGRVAVLNKEGRICFYNEEPMSRKEALQYLNNKY
jgi:hypothetical protein